MEYRFNYNYVKICLRQTLVRMDGKIHTQCVKVDALCSSLHWNGL